MLERAEELQEVQSINGNVPDKAESEEALADEVKQKLTSDQDGEILRGLELFDLLSPRMLCLAECIVSDAILPDLLLEAESNDRILTALLQALSSACSVSANVAILRELALASLAISQDYPVDTNIGLQASILQCKLAIVKADTPLCQLTRHVAVARAQALRPTGRYLELLMLLAHNHRVRDYLADEVLPLVSIRSCEDTRELYAFLVCLQLLTDYPAGLSASHEALRRISQDTGCAGDSEGFREDAETITARVDKLVVNQAVMDLLGQVKVRSSESVKVYGLVCANLARAEGRQTKLVSAGILRRLIDLEHRAPGEEPALVVAVARLLCSFDSVLGLHFGEASTAASMLLRAFSNSALYLQGLFLVALTNLCAQNAGEACALVIREWRSIESAMYAGDVLCMRARAELVCNLSAGIVGAAFLLDPANKLGADCLKTIINDARALDMQTRRAATGTLALLSRWSAMAPRLSEVAEEMLSQLVAEEDSEVLQRLLAFVAQVLQAYPAGRLAENVRRNRALRLKCEAVQMSEVTQECCSHAIAIASFTPS
ncbi:SWI5-dependent HO expression protein 4 [Savitreella phatthalungensis]